MFLSAICKAITLAFIGCGGLGGVDIYQPLTLPAGHGLTAGQIVLLPGASGEHGNVVVSCPAGGQACILNVAADGSTSYDKNGGTPSIMTAFATQTLPPGHGLAAGAITVDPGQSMEHGNVVVSCPAGGQACVLNVAEDGSASYPKTGGMPILRILPLMAGPGQSLSDVTPVFARDEATTLASALARNAVPVLSGGIDRQSGESDLSSADFFVKSVQRDGDGDYVVNYVLDGTEGSVAFEPSDCNNIQCWTTVDGRGFHYWSWTRDEEPSIHDGLSEYSYMASLTFGTLIRNESYRRLWVVFGLRTEDMPMGDAVYHGRFRARSFQTDNWAWNRRQNYSGTVSVVADFDMRRLEGYINQVEGSPPGSDTRDDWPNSSFKIKEGRIVNGQFTAILEGDGDTNTLFSESVRGFMGHILGEFYGPNAEEMGGVVTATRDVEGTENDRVLYGFIGTRKVGRLIGVNDANALLTATRLDYDGDTASILQVDKVTLESTTNGFTITAGDIRVEFKESDFGTNPLDSNEYFVRKGNLSFAIDQSSTGSFTGPRKYEHLDINRWDNIERGNDGYIDTRDWGYIVYGNRTTDPPASGTGVYKGERSVIAYEFPRNSFLGIGDASTNLYRGDLDLMANFANSEVEGRISNLERRPGGGRYTPAEGALTFNATVSGNGFSATDLAGSGALADYSNGKVRGAFYGPAATEVGAVFEGTDSVADKILSGYFAGERQ